MGDDRLLAYHVTGHGPTVVFLHGFTQTATSWRPITEQLSTDFRCVTVDLPGHGGSPNGRRSLVETADDVARLIGALGEPAIVVGYSMGARVALHVALSHPRLVSGLVLVSGTAGITDDAERAARRTADESLAEHIEQIGTEAFVSEWLAQPMFASLPSDAASIEERLTNSPTGLAESLRHAGTGTQTPLWSRLGELTMPTLVVTGDLDTKFTALGEELSRELPGALHERIPGAGHTLHLERPGVFVSLLRQWLATLT